MHSLPVSREASAASLRPMALSDVGAVLSLFETSVPFSLAAAGVSRSLLNAVARGEPSGAFCRAACVIAEAGAGSGGSGGGGVSGAAASAPLRGPRRLVGAVLSVTVPARPLRAGPAAAPAGEKAAASGALPPPPPPPPPPPKLFHLKFDLLREPPAEQEVVVVLAVAVEPSHRRCGLGTDLVFAGVRVHSLESPRTVAALFYAPYGHDAPIAFVETCGFCLFGRSSRYYRPAAAGAGDACDALLFVSVFSDAAELEDYSAADDALALPDVADGAALDRAKARRAPRCRFALPFAILAALSLAVYVAVLVGPLSFIADGLRDAAAAAAATAAAAHRGGASAAAKPPGAAPFANPPGMSIVWGPGGGEAEL